MAAHDGAATLTRIPISGRASNLNPCQILLLLKWKVRLGKSAGRDAISFNTCICNCATLS